jgi:ATP-binding cassette subfamily F protein uup
MEFQQLEQDIETLEAEKASIEAALSGGSISVEQITEMSKRLPLLNEELDEKSMRWLELSEYA